MSDEVAESDQHARKQREGSQPDHESLAGGAARALAVRRIQPKLIVLGHGAMVRRDVVKADVDRQLTSLVYAQRA